MLLPARNPSPWTGPTGNNTYLLDGAVPTLVDAGVGDLEHVADVAKALAGRPLVQVLLTHGHVDHASGLPALALRWPALRVRRLAADAPDADDVADGDLIPAGDGVVRALATPGHAPDHCCFAVEEESVTTDVYCGDLIRAGGSIVIAARHGGDLQAYLRSLERLRALEPRRLLPGHGPVIAQPRAAIDAYLQHRAERESQVLSLLQTAPHATATALARTIYRGLDPSLEPAAIETILAHLIKLEREARVVRDGEQWALREADAPQAG